MDYCPAMTTLDLFPHLFRQANRRQVTADLPGRIIENPQGDCLKIIKFLSDFLMDAFAEPLYIHAGIPEWEAHKRALAIFILKGIMHSMTHGGFDHHTPTCGHIAFATVDREMRVAISSRQIVDRPADFI